MALKTNLVAMADGGGSGKKKTAATTTPATSGGGSTTHVSSSGKEHGGSSGSFGSSNNAGVGAALASGLGKAASQAASSGGNSLADRLTGIIKDTTNNVIAAAQNANNGGGSGGGSGGSGGGGGGSSSSSPAASQSNYDSTVPSVFGDTQDPELVAQYQAAMAALEKMKGEAPTYGNQYDAQIQELYQQIIGRGPFKYDQKTDPLYQQYVQDYVQQGKMAMRDTMGRAAGLTGGYGSSYGQAVGQQQYDQYIQKLGDILPETYGMALSAWEAEGDQLDRKLATTQDLEKTDYDRYLDKLQQHNIDVERAQTDADTWYERMTAAEKQNYNRQLDQYDMQQDYYNRLISLIQTGYTPSKDDYAKAGLSQAQGEALRGTYMPQPQTVYVGSGNSSASNTSDADSAFEKALLSALGGSGTTGLSKKSTSSRTSTTTTKKNYGNGGR